MRALQISLRGISISTMKIELKIELKIEGKLVKKV